MKAGQFREGAALAQRDPVQEPRRWISGDKGNFPVLLLLEPWQTAITTIGIELYPRPRKPQNCGSMEQKTHSQKQ